jgi:hypothetical protein
MAVEDEDAEVQPPLTMQIEVDDPSNRKVKQKTTPVLSKVPKKNIVKKKLPPHQKFHVVFKPLDNLERWQQMNDDEWIEDVGLGNFYNWTW